MTAANSEDGRKCYLMVRYGGVTRRIEWNTTWKSFERLETKVRALFHIESKLKLNFKYIASKGMQTEHITMSTDEEWGVALELLQGDEIVVLVEHNQRKKRGALGRVQRFGKAMKPKALAACAAVGAYLPRSVVTNFSRSVAGLSRSVPRPSLRDVRATIAHINYRKLFTALAILGFAMFIHHAPRFSAPVRVPRGEQFTIVAATWGGDDVTVKVQKYYTATGKVWADNKVFGDPLVGQKKYLHITYQHTTGHTTTTFSESIPEYLQPQVLSSKYEDCLYSSEVVVDGHHVRVLGALYEGNQVTCAVKKMAYTGRISEWPRAGSEVSGKNFVVPQSGLGMFTLIYLKDNQLKVFKGTEGTLIKF